MLFPGLRGPQVPWTPWSQSISYLFPSPFSSTDPSLLQPQKAQFALITKTWMRITQGRGLGLGEFIFFGLCWTCFLFSASGS